MIAAIQAFFPRYPTRQAVTLPALHVVNERLRHVPLQAVVEIAELLELARPGAGHADVLRLLQAGRAARRLRVWVCRSISCHLRGRTSCWSYLCQRTGIAPGETTPDGELTLEFAECLGACEHAPCMLADDTLHKPA